MISYAQNAEDVVLARALPGASGFYVDVGAADPYTASITHHFYHRGWWGINIEPRDDAMARLLAERPRDVNLAVLAGSHQGVTEFHIVEDDPDLSTIDLTGLTRSTGHSYRASTRTVEMRTLDDIFAEHHVESIDFLKIDAEGAELDVLKGVDLARWRPRVLVIEAIAPYSRVRTDSEWRPIVEEAGYREAFFDGVNIFFGRCDEPEVLEALVPASAVDGFTTAHVVELETELRRLRGYIHSIEEALATADRYQAEFLPHVRFLEAQLGADTRTDLVPEVNRTRRAYRAPRLAVCSTPSSGESLVTRAAAHALAVRPIIARHPADVQWGRLPGGFVLQLSWPRTRLLESILRAEGIQVVSPARHPFDVLAILAHRARNDASAAEWLSAQYDLIDNDGQTLAWARSDAILRLLAVTPGWWATPASTRVRYESWFANPGEELSALFKALDLRPVKDPVDAVAEVNGSNGREPPPLERPGAWVHSLPRSVTNHLVRCCSDLFEILGYEFRGAATP